MAEPLILFKPSVSYLWVAGLQSSSASSNFDGESEEPGVPVYYYTDGDADEIKLEILEGERVIFRESLDPDKGLHKYQWRHNKILRERTDRERQQLKQMIERYKAYGYTEEDLLERFGSFDYIYGKVSPGKYRLRLVAGDDVLEEEMIVMADHWY